MAYAYVQTAQGSTTTNATTTVVSPNFASNPTSGNLIFAGVSYDASSAGTLPTVAVSDTLGNSYTLIDNVWDAANALWAGIYYAKNIIGGGSNALTATFGGGIPGSFYKAVMGAEYSGFDTVAPFTAGQFNGQEVSPASTGTDALVSGVTPTLGSQPAGVIGLGSILHSLSGPPVSGTGYTSRGTMWDFGFGSPNFATLEDKRVTATTAVQATFTPASTGLHAAFVAVFNESSGTVDDTPARSVFKPGLKLGTPLSRLRGRRSSDAPLSVNVTVALTGQSFAFSSGTLAPSTSVPLVGSSASSVAGNLAVSNSVALTGQSSSFTLGSLVPGVSITIAGQSLALSTGLLLPSLVVNALGSSATFSAGTLVASTSVGLTGQSVTSTAGTQTPSDSVTLTGQVLTFGLGILTATGGNPVGGAVVPIVGFVNNTGYLSIRQ